MLLILPSAGKPIIQDQVSGRIAYAALFGIRAVSLCFFLWTGSLLLFGLRAISLCFSFCLRAGNFMLLILPPGGMLIIEDQVSERIDYAHLFGLRTVSLCFSLCSEPQVVPTRARRRNGTTGCAWESPRRRSVISNYRGAGRLEFGAKRGPKRTFSISAAHTSTGADGREALFFSGCGLDAV